MVKAKKFIYAKRFEGMPKLDDFILELENLPELKDGGKNESCLLQWSRNRFFFFENSFSSDVLVEALYLSVDPYMRKYMQRYPLGVPMIGLQIAKYVLHAYYCSKVMINQHTFLFCSTIQGS